MKKEVWTSAGAVVSALASSACCWLPLLLLGLGVSGLGVAAVFARFRFVFLGVAAGLLALGFYLNYRRVEVCGPDGSCTDGSPRMRRLSRSLLWLSAILVVAFALFPGLVGRPRPLSGQSLASASEEIGERSSLQTLQVSGMTCGGCEASIEQALLSVPGVLAADADYEKGEAVVTIDGSVTTSGTALSDAVATAGYRAERGDDSTAVAGLAGRWTARFVVGERETANVVLDLARIPTRWAGEYDVPAFGVEDYPVAVEYAPPSVVLHLSGIDADFEGTFSSAEDVIRGIAKTTEHEHPLDFRRTGDAQLSETFWQLEAAADDSTHIRTLSANGAELRARFNATRGQVRLILLLSPT